MDGGLFARERSSRKRSRCQLRIVLGDVEFADDITTCSAASSASAFEELFVPNAQKDRLGHSSAVKVPLHLRLTKVHIDLINSPIFCCSRFLDQVPV